MKKKNNSNSTRRRKEKLISLAEAMYDGGIRLLELTFSADGHISDEETAENIRMLTEHFEDRMYIGARTVITEKQVELAKKYVKVIK